MNFIIGGSFQGKLEFALEQLNLQESDAFVCTAETTDVDWTKPILTHIEQFALGCVRRGEEPRAYWEAHRDQLAEKTLIADDISCGVVPIETEIRAWREASGRANNYLAGEADRVWRVFCGLGQVMK